MKKSRLLSLAFVVLCSVATVSLAAPDTPNVPAGHPKIEYPAQSTTHQQSEPLTGKVLQVLNGGGYSYIYLQKDKGEKTWIAVTEIKANAGDRMSFKEGLVMKNFQSKTLKRTFDSIVFSNGVVPQPGKAAASSPAKAAPQAAAPSKQQSAPMGSKVAVMPKEKRISVQKATGPNAYTIAEIYRNSAKLDKKQIVVRGKIVKVTSRIMKRNWVHIQDGSGSQAKGTHNLVCTTTATPHLDDVVTVKGTVAKDRDFGYGYHYNVLIENATISK
ncbi:MAG: DNA-binding protein [Oryzomonas sp.]|uniref:DNA-binding protein n=1 Tax=Oryzomonas sp. TaxID=2855186 RepID=UPI00284C2221|nr:DNA-binding protein [Oryzomonas sp.]MDR3581548.1 DNA-binding protein [Oryzomonas sp.]